MASLVSVGRSVSRAPRRCAETQALVRSTTHRHGRTANPFTSSLRLTTSSSIDSVSLAQASMLSSTALAYPPSTQPLARPGRRSLASRSVARPATRSLTCAEVTVRGRSHPQVSTTRFRFLPRQCLNLSKPMASPPSPDCTDRSEEHTSELQSLRHLVCRLLLEK